MTPEEQITLGKKHNPHLTAKRNKAKLSISLSSHWIKWPVWLRRAGWVLGRVSEYCAITFILDWALEWASVSVQTLHSAAARGNNGTRAHLSSLLSQLSFIPPLFTFSFPVLSFQRNQVSSQETFVVSMKKTQDSYLHNYPIRSIHIGWRRTQNSFVLYGVELHACIYLLYLCTILVVLILQSH